MLNDIIAAILARILIIFACTGLWYCFDDWAASFTNYPPLGTIPFWNLFSVMVFVAFVRGLVREMKASPEN